MAITFGPLLLDVCADCCCCCWADITSWMETRVLPYNSLLLTGRSSSSDDDDDEEEADSGANLDRTCR